MPLTRAPRILLTSDAVGGVWRYSIELAAGLAAHGAEIVMAVLGPPPGPAQLVEACAIPRLELQVTSLPLDWTADAPSDLAAAAKQLAAGCDADLAHLHAPALAAARWQVPVVAVAHSDVATWWQSARGGPLPDDLAWRAEATARGIRAATLVVAPSAAYARALSAVYGEREIRVVHNGLQAMPAPARARRRDVLAVGRVWDEGKNMQTLDEAARRMDAPIRVAGALCGPNGASVSLRHVQLLGPLSTASLREEYAGSGLFVSAAVYEPFGLAALEAAHAGTALVLSDIPTHRELWDGAALFVAPRDGAGFAAACASLLDDPAEAERLGALARKRALPYSRASMVTATEALHLSLTRVGT